MKAPFPVVGLTGGIASGKSFLGGLLVARGWILIDADQVARDLVAPGSEGLAALAEAFGPEILGPDGTLDRRSLGRLVFADAGARLRLEGLLHPRIISRMFQVLDELPAECPGAVLDAALWVERGLGHHFDELWVVEAPESLRIERLRKRDGLEPMEAQARIRAQTTDAERRLHADRIFVADGRELHAELDLALKALARTWRSRRRQHWPGPGKVPLAAAQIRRLLGLFLAGGAQRAELQIQEQGPDCPASIRLRRFSAGSFKEHTVPLLEETRLEELAKALAGTVPSGAWLPPKLERFARPSPLAVRPGQGRRTWVAWADSGSGSRPRAGLSWDLRPVETPRTEASLPALCIPQGAGEPSSVLLQGRAAHAFLRAAFTWLRGRGLSPGSPVAPATLTLIEDSTLPGHAGSFAIDDAGRPSGRHLLIERGLLVGDWSDGPGSDPARNLIVLPDPGIGMEPGPEIQVEELAWQVTDPDGTWTGFAPGTGPNSVMLRGRIPTCLAGLEPGPDFEVVRDPHGRPLGALPSLLCKDLEIHWA